MFTPREIPTEDSTVIARYREAGAILLGKLSMYEFALGGPDPTTQFALARNPWNLEHIPGGSSSGSGSAVASGQCMGALGSCTGGSIRGPASYCGVVGLKATYGRVSRAGVVTLSWSQDHCGPLTWTVEDAALMLQAIAGHDSKDPASSTAPTSDYAEAIREDISGLVVGLPRHFFFDPRPSVDPEVQATVETAVKELESLGARVEEVTIPSLEYVRSANSIIMLTEAYSFHADNLRNRPGDYGQQARVRFRTGGLLSASDYLQATKIRQVAKREFAQALEKVDVLVSPTMTQPAAPFQGYDPATTARDPKLHGAIQLYRSACHLRALWVHPEGPASGYANRRKAFCRTGNPASGPHLRAARRLVQASASRLGQDGYGMEKRKLGSLKVPIIGLGTARTFDVDGKSDVSVRRTIVDNCTAAGSIFLDTSPMYGHSESVIGQVTDGRRDQFQFATKVWCRGDSAGRNQIAQSFDLLRIPTTSKYCRYTTCWTGEPTCHIWNL